ncbi:MAG: PIN domain nuclease, partial [Candidatus Hydrothermarchaeaceae archaeon]
MYLIDTNIFLEVMLSRSKGRECEGFLDPLKSGEKRGFVTDFSIHSIIVIMGSYGKKRELKEFLKS